MIRTLIPALPFCQVRLSARSPSNPTYPTELKTLGDHLRKRRLDLDLLQHEVAEQLGVDDDSVCHWATSYSIPKPYLIPRVIEFLGYAPWAAPATFGEWLVMARRANGLSRKRFAKRLGVDDSTVFRWKSGRGRPGSRLLARLKGAFTLGKNQR